MDDARRLSTSDIAAAMDRREEPVHDHDHDHERERLARTGMQVKEDGLSPDSPGPLFATDELTGYRTRWSGIQTGFVDEPRKAVEEADSLVAELMKRLAEVFADERRKLESQWERSDQVSTEDLRIAMRRYRSFFERLLSI